MATGESLDWVTIERDDIRIAWAWVDRTKQITDAVGIAMVQYHEVKEKLLNAKMDLEVSYARGIAEGDIFGKNEGERKARGRELLESLYATVENLEVEERVGKINLDLAQLEDSEFKQSLRLLELFGNMGTAYLFYPITSRIDDMQEKDEEESIEEEE